LFDVPPLTLAPAPAVFPSPPLMLLMLPTAVF
jgi:hypothetical protein